MIRMIGLKRVTICKVLRQCVMDQGGANCRSDLVIIFIFGNIRQVESY